MSLTLLICKQNILYILYPFSQLNISFNSTHFKKVIYFLYRPTCPLKDTYFILVLVFRYFQHEKITFVSTWLCNTFYFSTGFQSKRHFPLTRFESKICCYIPRLSLNQTGTAIGWLLVTWPWLKSNVSLRDIEAMYHARDTLQHVIKAWWKVAWQKAGKKTASFLFREWTSTQTWSLKL